MRRRFEALLAGAAIAVAACGGSVGLHPSASPVPAARATPVTSVAQPGSTPALGEAFVDAWAAFVGTHDEGATELLIANPISEYDLVGARLIDLIDRTRGDLSELTPPAALGEEVRALDASMAGTLALLRAIDPDAPRTDQEAAFRRALDDWVDHVIPDAQSIRDALGMAPVPAGDLQL
jgi:hypothetical protein